MLYRPRLVEHVLVVILFAGLVPGACSGMSGEPGGNPMGEGFQKSLPLAGTRAVVWGNNQDSMTRTRGWLQGKGLVVVDQNTVEEKLKNFDLTGKSRMEQSAHILEAGKTIDAELGVFVFVEDHQLNPNSGSMPTGHQSPSVALVKAWGQDVQTAEIIFSGKAWNSTPMVVSSDVVLNLTDVALQNAWGGDGQTPSPPLKVAASERAVFAQGKSTQQPVTDTPNGSTISSNPELPEETSTHPEDPSVGLQVASGALSILYTPIKLVYAGVGGIVGGLAYVMTAGNERVAQSVWDASLRGTYWLKPSHLKGEEPIYFLGPSTVGERQSPASKP